MGKNKKENFSQKWRNVWDKKYNLDYKAIYLYDVLNELEHQFTGEKKDWFFRSLDDLINDSRMSKNTIIKHRKELIEHGFIEIWKHHWDEDGKKSVKHITAYRILK